MTWKCLKCEDKSDRITALPARDEHGSRTPAIVGNQIRCIIQLKCNVCQTAQDVQVWTEIVVSQINIGIDATKAFKWTGKVE